jgi:hypothetical protein
VWLESGYISIDPMGSVNRKISKNKEDETGTGITMKIGPNKQKNDIHFR